VHHAKPTFGSRDFLPLFLQLSVQNLFQISFNRLYIFVGGGNICHITLLQNIVYQHFGKISMLLTRL